MGELYLGPNTTTVDRQPIRPVEGWKATDFVGAFNPYVEENSKVATYEQASQPTFEAEESIPYVPITEEATIFQELMDKYVEERKAPIAAMTVAGSNSADQLAAWKNDNAANIPYPEMSLGDLIDATMANVDRQLAEMKALIAQPTEVPAVDVQETGLMTETIAPVVQDTVAQTTPMEVIREQKLATKAAEYAQSMFRDETPEAPIVLSERREARRNKRSALLGKVAAGLAIAGFAFGGAYYTDNKPADVQPGAQAAANQQQMEALNLTSAEQGSKIKETKSKVGKFLGKYLVGLAR